MTDKTPPPAEPVEPSAEQPSAEQIENAKRAGWDTAVGPPPAGWDAHGTFDPGLSASSDPTEHLTTDERIALGIDTPSEGV